VTAGVALAIIEPIALLGLDPRVMNVLYLVLGLCVVGVPISFMSAVLRRAFARNAISVLAGRLLTTDVDVVLPALREALADPTLEILYRMPNDGRYVDATGNGRQG